jgi:hypothetical protein
MSPADCAASQFLNASGPAVVPFQLCCVLAIVTAAGSASPQIICGAAPTDPSATLLWPDPDSDLPTIGEPAR